MNDAFISLQCDISEAMPIRRKVKGRIRVLCTLPKDLVDRLDRLAEETDSTRGEVMDTLMTADVEDSARLDEVLGELEDEDEDEDEA